MIDRQIILMRHATTEEINEQGDIHRNLTEIGKRQANITADFIANYKIDKVLVSPAVRTRQTLSIILSKNKIDNIQILDQLYRGEQKDIVQAITEQKDMFSNLLIIGHNPNIYAIALNLASKEDPKYIELINFPMTPASSVVLKFHNLDAWKSLVLYSGDIKCVKKNL